MPAPPIPTFGLPSGADEHTVFRSLFIAYPDALLLVDQAGRIVLANPAAAALLGYGVDELIGLNVDALVPDSIRPDHAAYRKAYGQAPKARPMGAQMELVARRKDGSEVIVEIALSPLQDHGLPFVVVAVRGIGAYPRVRKALQRAAFSEHLAQLGRLAVDARDPQVVLDRAPAMAVEALQVDAATVFVLDNNLLEFRVVSGVGLVPGEAAGQRMPNLASTPAGFVLQQTRAVYIPDYRREKRFTVPPAYLDAGLVSSLAVPLLERGRTIGVLSVRTRSPHVFGEDEVGFLESLANLLATSLQRARTEEALSHAQRLESVGQLTGGIAHDFNNLLTVILGNLQVLEDLPALVGDTRGRQLVAAAARASKRGAELTGKLLAFSRRQVLQPSTVDVGELLNALSDMLRRTLDQRIRIMVDVQAGCPPALADASQLESALLNIAINARDAMPDGGTLRFRAEGCGGLPAELRTEPAQPGSPSPGFVAISLQDTGTGMPAEVAERAFEPFFTTKETGRGTGLGLSTVYGFAKQSKGAVTIGSAMGAGTLVTLYLPVSRGGDAVLASETAKPQAFPAGLRILLVEDDAEVRAVLSAFLQPMHCPLVFASTGEQALRLLEDADFDLLLTDIALGAGMRGTQLAARAQQRSPQLAVLLMSGFSSELLDASPESAAPWDLLRKPFTRAGLFQAIAGVLRSP